MVASSDCTSPETSKNGLLKKSRRRSVTNEIHLMNLFYFFKSGKQTRRSKQRYKVILRID